MRSIFTGIGLVLGAVAFPLAIAQASVSVPARAGSGTVLNYGKGNASFYYTAPVAAPTSTPLLPTAAPSSSPTASSTPSPTGLPLPTALPTATPSSAPTPTIPPTAAPTPTGGRGGPAQGIGI